MSKHKQLTIVLEKGDGELWGRVESPYFLLTTVGNSVDEITTNLRDLIVDFVEHEGKDISGWKNVAANEITFTYEYDLTALFDIFNVLKINEIANSAGINKSLLRQYATGKKHPSQRQAKKIEMAVRELGQKLIQVTVA